MKRQHEEALSREWIAANGVTAEQVQRCDAEGVPWFGTVYEFGKWLRSTDCQKRWATWNDTLYPTAELKDGIMERRMATAYNQTLR